VTRELSPESVLHQAAAYLTWAKRADGVSLSTFTRWAAGKAFLPADLRAVRAVVKAALPARREKESA
jgi:hypothetical protein